MLLVSSSIRPHLITTGALLFLAITSGRDFAQSAAPQLIPPGAAELGYTKLLIDEHPVVGDISNKQSGHSKWFRNPFYTFNPPKDGDFEMTPDGVLQIGPRVSIVSTPRDFSKGALPVLSGAKGFYIEFEVRLSDNNPDHWPAVWTLPVEHNLRQEDHYRGDPPKFERWLELDVDEGSFGPGSTTTAISWQGIYPHYHKTQNGNNVSKTPLDRTQWHTFGASYDPIKSQVTWWLDGEKTVTATTPDVPAIAAKQHFYLIVSNQERRMRIPYLMYLRAVRAYVPAN
jgi:hypothetical protein